MAEKKKGKVISMKRWVEIHNMVQTIKSGMFYQAFIEDLSDLDYNDKADYFGLVYCIPGEDRSDQAPPFDLDQNQLIMMIDVEDDSDLFYTGERGVERYEIHDMVTDDVHVMFRVPYPTPKLKAVKKPIKPLNK
ncbi:MAG: hypothetical protein ACOWYE_12600 [Desulfatiglandales bacterium]